MGLFYRIEQESAKAGGKFIVAIRPDQEWDAEDDVGGWLLTEHPVKGDEKGQIATADDVARQMTLQVTAKMDFAARFDSPKDAKAKAMEYAAAVAERDARAADIVADAEEEKSDELALVVVEEGALA